MSTEVRLWLCALYMWLLGMILLSHALPLPWTGRIGAFIIGSLIGILVLTRE